MNSERLFYGNLVECTKCQENTLRAVGDTSFGSIDVETRPYLDNVLLLKTKNGWFVPISGLSPAEIAYMYFENIGTLYRSDWASNHFLSVEPDYVGEVTVDAKSLVPYGQTKTNVSLLAAKKIEMKKREMSK